MTRQQWWEDLKRRAEAGDAEAQWEVGSWFEDGLTGADGSVIVRPSGSSAFLWYRRSAEAGCASAQINMGNCLSTGLGVRRDDPEALLWYKKALRQGNRLAPSNIATVYRDRGDDRRAMFWYRRAVACGDDDDALVEVGWRCYAGVGVRRDAGEAVRCFREAIASKHITEWGREEAMLHLGKAYLDGCGVKRSPALAIHWLTRANRDGDRPDVETLVQEVEGKRRRTKPRTVRRPAVAVDSR